MNNLKRLIALPVLALAASGASFAAETQTADFQVRMVIQESCTISSAPTDIDFLTHARSTGAPVSATGSLTVNCSAGTPYQIGLDSGIHASSEGVATSGGRRMSNGNALVPYELYQDSSLAKLWGNTESVDMLSAIGTAQDQSHTVHGRVPSTNFPAGTYTDTVTARVVY